MQKVKGRRWTARDERQAVLRRILVLLILLWQFCEQTNPYVNYHGGSCQVIKILKKQDLQPAGVCMYMPLDRTALNLTQSRKCEINTKKRKIIGSCEKGEIIQPVKENVLLKFTNIFLCMYTVQCTVGENPFFVGSFERSFTWNPTSSVCIVVQYKHKF